MRQPVHSEVRPVQTNTLNQQLDQIESLQGKVGLGYGNGALVILEMMDSVDERIRKALKQGASLPAEEAQFQAITETYRKQAGAFLREIGGLGRLEEVRQQAVPPSDNWWWWPEKIVAEKRASGLRNALRSGGIALAVLLIVVVIYQIFLKPDPSVVAAQLAIQSAERTAYEGDLEKALQIVEEGLTAAPNEPELLVIKGCLLSMIPGKAELAPQVFAEAEKWIADRETFLLLRAQVYLNLNSLDFSLRDAQAAVDANPKSAKGYLVLGQVFESSQRQDEAYVSYETASNLAGELNDSVTAAQARIKMGMLLQVMNVNSMMFPTPTPTD